MIIKLILGKVVNWEMKAFYINLIILIILRA